MSRFKRLLPDRRFQAGLATALLAGLVTALVAIALVVVGLVATRDLGSPVLGQWGYGYGYGYAGAGGGRAPSDTTAPGISEDSIATSDISPSSAIITWTTDETSDSQVEYWPGSLSALDVTLVTSHSVALTGLKSETTYHYKARSRDAWGNLAVSEEHTFTTLGAVDSTPPVLYEVLATDITATGATISWTTDETSDGQVEYWVTTKSATPLDATLVTSHSFTLADLTPEATYHFQVRSKDASGNLAISDEYTFTTLAAPTGWALIGGIIAGVLVAGGLAWLVVYVVRRRRG